MLALFIVMGPGFNEYYINSCTVVYFSGLQLAVYVLPQFNSLRANYVMAAMILERVKSDFNLDTYRNFVRHCRTDEEMVNSLKALYQLPSEEEVFIHLFLK